MKLFHDNVDDRAIADAEQILRRELAQLPPEEGPSKPYWDMYANRVMARIEREQKQPARPRWSVLWKPLVSISAVGIAVASFVLLRPAELTLDQETASLPAEELQTLRQAEAPIVPAGNMDALVSSEFETVAKHAQVDEDVMLAFNDVDADQLSSAVHATQTGSEPYSMEDLTDDDANAVIANMQSSL